MSEQLLTVLTFCLLALVYLFFFRVVRAVWAEVNPPRVATRAPSPRKARAAAVRAPAPVGIAPSPAPAPAASGVPPTQLRVVEPADRRGTVYTLTAETVLGRGADCQIVLDDTFASTHHARVRRTDDRYLVEDLGSTNGTWCNRKKVVSPVAVRVGDRLQIGNTVLEFA